MLPPLRSSLSPTSSATTRLWNWVLLSTIRLVSGVISVSLHLSLSLLRFADGRALFKLMPPEDLRQARDAKLAAVQEKAARKAATAAAAEAKRLERLEKGRTPPTELFRSSPDYSAWDEQGIPTLDKEGVEVPKSRKKKCQKEWDAQKK